MNPAEETNLLAEIAVLREVVKLLIAHLPDGAGVTAQLEALSKRVVEVTPPYTQQRVAIQRALKLIDPLGIGRQPAGG